MRLRVTIGLLLAVAMLAPVTAKHAAGDYAAAPAAFEHGGSDRTSLSAAPDPFAHEADAGQWHNPALQGLWNVAEAHDGSLFALSGSSVIASPYRDREGRVVGVLGVIGPTRLNYARVVPMVDLTARFPAVSTNRMHLSYLTRSKYRSAGFSAMAYPKSTTRL
jgi:hypothetical protein